MLMGLELKMACPRATAARGFVEGNAAQASKGLKIAEVNWPSPGVTSPPGCSNCGRRKWTLELMLIKNGWLAGTSGRGPSDAPCAFNRPVSLSAHRAVNSAILKFTICGCFAGDGLFTT